MYDYFCMSTYKSRTTAVGSRGREKKLITLLWTSWWDGSRAWKKIVILHIIHLRSWGANLTTGTILRGGGGGFLLYIIMYRYVTCTHYIDCVPIYYTRVCVLYLNNIFIYKLRAPHDYDYTYVRIRFRLIKNELKRSQWKKNQTRIKHLMTTAE